MESKFYYCKDYDCKFIVEADLVYIINNRTYFEKENKLVASLSETGSFWLKL